MFNYHHLRYFREVAREGHLTRAADRLNVSQSALSAQIRTLEERLGHALFDRVGRRLELTEVGRIALEHADRIFAIGDELTATLDRSGTARAPLRLGAPSTLSRNFQLQFLRPVLDQADIVLRSGSTAQLLDGLRSLALDIVLTTEPPASSQAEGLVAHRLDAQPVGLYGQPRFLGAASLRDLLANAPLILPTDSSIRVSFDALVARLGITPRIVADVDDMAMVRLLAREGVGLALAPAVVLADEIASGIVHAAPFDLDLQEPFYAVTIHRNFPHPLITALLDRHSGENSEN